MNFCMFQGHLTADPVVRQGQDGKLWCSGKIGVWQGNDQNGNALDSLFIDFVCYGKDAETMGQLGKKGDLVVVSGTFRETKSVGNDGKEYINKRVSGQAKVCKKLETAQQPMQQPVQQYAQPQYQQPQQAQMNQVFGQPQQPNMNPWG